MIFQFFRARQTSAPVARERLQILLAHERQTTRNDNLLNLLRKDILQVVSKHIAFDTTKLKINMQRGEEVSTLEIELELPRDVQLTANVA